MKLICGLVDIMFIYLTRGNSLLGAVILVKNADIGEYKYSGFGIGFYRCETFSVGNGFGKNVIIFGVDMSSFLHVDHKKKDILILDDSPTQRLGHTTLTSEKKYLVNFTESRKKFFV